MTWRSLRRRLGVVVLIGVACAIPQPGGLEAAESSPSDFLYRLAQEHRRVGRSDEAIHELQKLLLIEPQHRAARRELAQLQAEQSQRVDAMDEVLRQAEAQRQQGRAAAIEQAIQQVQGHESVTPEAAPLPRAQTTPAQEGAVAERLGLPTRAPFGLDQVVTPPEAGRPEILSETKRAGFQKLYKEGIGFQPVRGLGLSARTEIFEEPNPVEDYIIESKILRFETTDTFRRSITPLFTRSWAARVVADYEPWPRLTYEYDFRDVEHEFETRYNFKNRNLETHAVNLLYTLPRVPLVGFITLNPWYKRVFQQSDQDVGSFEDKDELIVNLSLQPTENLEYFFQYDTYEASKTKTLGGSRLKLFKGQVRTRFPSLRLFVIPSIEYSDTDFDPSDDEFSKRDYFVDWGFDLTKRLRASSKQQFIEAETSQPGQSPSNPDAEVFNTFNTLSYELVKDFDVSFGVDYSKGFGFNDFNNVGLRTEMELFKPGIIRAKLGYEWLSYYNLSEHISLLYWKFFLFQ